MRLHEAPNRATARKEAPQTELSCTPIPPTQFVGYILSYPSYIIYYRLSVRDRGSWSYYLGKVLLEVRQVQLSKGSRRHADNSDAMAADGGLFGGRVARHGDREAAGFGAVRVGGGMV